MKGFSFYKPGLVCAWLVLSLVFSTGAFAKTVVSGVSLTVALDDSVTILGSGSGVFFGGVGSANSSIPFSNGWSVVSGSRRWTDTNRNTVLLLNSSGFEVPSSGRISNTNGGISGNPTLGGSTTLGASIRTALGGGGSGSFVSVAGVNGSTTYDFAGNAVVNVANPDIAITIDNSTTMIEAGSSPGTVTHTITATNVQTGTNRADRVSVNVGRSAPAGVTITSTSASGGSSFNSTSGVWTVNSLSAGQSRTLTVVYTAGATAADGSMITTTGSLASLAQTDNSAANDSASASTEVISPEADLSITMSDSPDPVIAGNNVTYTINVSNAGPDDASGVVVTDMLPSGLTLVSTTGCAEDNAGAPTCTLGDIAASGSAQYTLVARVNPNVTASMITNTASVSASTSLINTGNDSVSETTTINTSADLSISISDVPDPVLAGNNLVYTVTVNNAGPSNAANVVVTDTLSAGLTLVSTNGCNEDPNGVPTCTLGTIAAGGSRNFTITAQTDPDSTAAGQVSNSASVTASTADPVSGNNSDSETTQVNLDADLAITVTDSVDPVVAGNGLVYTVRVDNNGPTNAKNVVATNTLPAGVTLSSVGGCASNPAGTTNCNIGTINSGGFFEYTINVTVNSSTTANLTDTASVTSSIPDSVSANNNTTQQTTVNTEADLVVSVTDNPDPVIAGNNITYTVTVSNLGPSDAQNVVVTDTLPAGVTFGSTSGCAADPNGVPTCGLGTIAAGGSAQFTISATVDSDTAPGTITNTASVTSSTTLINTGNDSTDTDTTVDTEADLTVTISDNFDPIITGLDLVYTVNVANAGPSDAQNVVMTGTLPAGLTFSSSSGCAEDPAGNPTCSLGAIAAGGSAQYTITAAVDNGTVGTITNSVSAASSTTLINTGDDSASEDTEVFPPPTVEFSQAAYSVLEDGSVIGNAITLTRSGNTDFETQVQVNLADGAVEPATGVSGGVGGDYDNDPITVTFPAGSTASQTVVVPVTQDAAIEGDETVSLSITNIQSATIGAQNTAVLTILNDDESRLVVSSPMIVEGNGVGTVMLEFDVTLEDPVQGGFSVGFTTADGTATLADNDYQAANGTLNFAGNAGESHSLSVLINADDIIELDETFSIALGPISNLIIPVEGGVINLVDGQGTIINDDLDPDNDGVASQIDNCPLNANSDQADLDRDGLGNVCDDDADGDGMPNDWEIENGLNPLNSFDQIADNDGDGFTNIEEFRFGTDPNVADLDENGNGRPDLVDERAKSVMPGIILLLLSEEIL